MSLTPQLKSELWKRFGSPEFPAEWDGNLYGGGKLSQRFWEYFKGIELLDLDTDSVVLDIGGGSPKSGLGFFSAILAGRVRKVIVLDPCVEPQHRDSESVEFIRRNADYEALKEIFSSKPEITHLSCISVFEHIDPKTRVGMTQAINEGFQGRRFVSTFEYHSQHMFFEHQLTMKTASELFRPLTRFYLERYEASPIWAENAFDRDPKFRLKDRRFFWQKPRLTPSFVPRWYPVALRFDRLE